MSNKIDKPKLTPQNLIEKMRDEKGIKFNLISEKEALDFLSNRNNYLRTSCYRAYFPKYQAGKNKGKYINLDFAYLKELSIIDMHYRFLVKKMCSDIEHFLCIQLLNYIDNDPTTDGYDIVEQFLKTHNFVIKNLERTINSPHIGDLIKKYFSFTSSVNPNTGKTIFNITAYDDCPAWVLIECLTFGDLLDFYSFYSKSRNISLPASRSTLNLVRNLRNGASHDVCLLCHLTAGTTKPSKEISSVIKSISTISISQRQKKLSSKTIQEFSALIFVYSVVVLGKVRNHRVMELRDLFFKRMVEKRSIFKSNEIIETSYDFCCKIINKFLYIT